MRKFNLFNEIIIVNKSDFLRAANSAKEFAISYSGNIVYAPFESSLISIFEGSVPPISPLNSDLSRPISSMLGTNYRIVEDDDRLLIKAFGAWQSIIGFNQKRALYDDTSGDGIDRFADSTIEQIGWHATEFNIRYREIVEEFEEHCDGLLICIEKEEPYQFSGLGFLFDLEHARKIAFDYCAREIKEKLEKDEEFVTLTDDETEAKDYFLS